MVKGSVSLRSELICRLPVFQVSRDTWSPGRRGRQLGWWVRAALGHHIPLAFSWGAT